MKGAGFRIGLFAIAGAALLALGIVLVGGRWLAATERAVMRFETSVFGLQVGAPVVFRGVRVGQVTAIGLARADVDAIAMPVTAEFDRQLLRDLLGSPLHGSESAVRALVDRGLVARLSTQSLLTGLLYVDLDLVPARADRADRAARGDAGRSTQDLPAIPTEATRLQTLQAQLGEIDLAQIGRDLAHLSAAARRLLEDPEAARLAGRISAAAQAIGHTARRVDQAVAPLARGGERTLEASRETLAEVSEAARRIARAAEDIRTVAAAAGPVAEAAGRAADEIARAAVALRETAADGSPLRTEADRALRELAGAGRALRELAELLRRRPDAVWRGLGEDADGSR